MSTEDTLAEFVVAERDGMTIESVRKRLERLESARELADIARRFHASEWQNPAPGVLTWLDYEIRRDGVRLSLYANGTLLDSDWLVDLKALAERDFAERVEMGEVEA